MVRRFLRQLGRPFVWVDRKVTSVGEFVPARTIKEANVLLAGQHAAERWNRRAIAALVLGLPLCAAVSITAGERGRDNVCDVVERTFHQALGDGVPEVIADVSDPPTTPEEVERYDRIVQGLKDGFHTRIDQAIRGCG